MNKVIEYQAPWIIGFQDGEHRVLENGAIVIDGDTIVHVGRRGQVPSAEIIETSSIIAPGFISLHCHMNESPVDKGLAEDMDKRQFWLRTSSRSCLRGPKLSRPKTRTYAHAFQWRSIFVRARQQSCRWV